MDNSNIDDKAVQVIAGTNHWETLSEDSVEYTRLQDTCYESIDLLYELLNEYCIPMAIKMDAIIERKYEQDQFLYNYETDLGKVLNNFKSVCSYLDTVINDLSENTRLLDDLMRHEVSLNSDANEL